MDRFKQELARSVLVPADGEALERLPVSSGQARGVHKGGQMHASLVVSGQHVGRRCVRTLLVVVVATLVATPTAAQPAIPETVGRVYSMVGAGFGDGTAVATGVGAGLRMTRHIGLDVELTHLSRGGGGSGGHPAFGDISAFSAMATLGAEDYPPLGVGDDDLFPLIRFEHRGRDVATFLTKFTVEFPVADGRLFPYLSGGGGVGRVNEHSSIVVDEILWTPLEESYSELGLAFVLGGGVDVRLWRGLGVGIDLRWLRVLRSYDALDTAQVAARASYRF